MPATEQERRDQERLRLRNAVHRDDARAHCGSGQCGDNKPSHGALLDIKPKTA
jgi:hypothetical protein